MSLFTAHTHYMNQVLLENLDGRSINNMLRQIVIYISHPKNGTIPQTLTMGYLDVMSVQLLVMSESSWNNKPRTVSWQQMIEAGMTLAKNALVQQT